MKYKARLGSRLSDKDAVIIGKEIERLSLNGVISEEIVVETAKSSKSPLHGYFEWDDKTAANLHRLETARSLIRSIVIESDDGKEVRAFHNVYIADEKNYVALDTALNSPDLWDQVIESALRQAQSWAQRYSTYRELKPIVKAINLTAAKIKEKSNESQDKRRRKNSTAEARL